MGRPNRAVKGPKTGKSIFGNPERSQKNIPSVKVPKTSIKQIPEIKAGFLIACTLFIVNLRLKYLSEKNCHLPYGFKQFFMVFCGSDTMYLWRDM